MGIRVRSPWGAIRPSLQGRLEWGPFALKGSVSIWAPPAMPSGCPHPRDKPPALCLGGAGHQQDVGTSSMLTPCLLFSLHLLPSLTPPPASVKWGNASPACLPVWVTLRVRTARGHKRRLVNSLWLCKPKQGGLISVPTAGSRDRLRLLWLLLPGCIRMQSLGTEQEALLSVTRPRLHLPQGCIRPPPAFKLP